MLSTELEFGPHLDPTLEAARHRARPCVEAVHSLCLLVVLAREPEAIADGDALDHEHPVSLEDLTLGCGLELAFFDLDLTRLQRAGKGARQSAPGGSDHVVEGGGRGREVVGRDSVVVGDLGVNAEGNRFLPGGEVREALRAAEEIYIDTGAIGGVGHAGYRVPEAAGTQNAVTAGAARAGDLSGGWSTPLASTPRPLRVQGRCGDPVRSVRP